jgi:hypothetical protein
VVAVAAVSVLASVGAEPLALPRERAQVSV